MAVNVLIVDDSAVMRAMLQKTMKLSGLQLGEIHIQTPFIPAAGASAAGTFAPVNAVSHLSVESGICRVALQLDGSVPAQGLAVNGGRMDGVEEGVGS